MKASRLRLALIVSLPLASTLAWAERTGVGDFTGEPKPPKIESLESAEPGGYRLAP